MRRAAGVLLLPLLLTGCIDRPLPDPGVQLADLYGTCDRTYPAGDERDACVQRGLTP